MGKERERDGPDKAFGESDGTVLEELTESMSFACSHAAVSLLFPVKNGFAWPTLEREQGRTQP